MHNALRKLKVDEKLAETSHGTSQSLIPKTPVTRRINFSLVYHLEATLLSSFHLEPDQFNWNKGPYLILPRGA